MSNRQKVTRVQLKVSPHEDYSLLGIVTAEPDYKLSLSLNRKLRISLKNNSPIEIKDENGTILHFSRFCDNGDSQDLTYNLISNRSENGSLIKKLSKIDYFLQIQSPEKDYKIERLAASLREIDSITAIFHINTGEIRDKNLHYLIS